MLPQEIEIKLDLQNEENYFKIIRRFEIIEKPKRQENIFFDSGNLDLSQNGWALRLRKEKDKSCFTIKGITADSSGGMAIRDEIEVSISDETAQTYIENGLQLENIPDEIAHIVLPILDTNELFRRLRFVNERYRVNYSTGQTDLIFEIDKTKYADGTIDYELEVELENRLLYQKVLDEISSFLKSLQIDTVFQKQSKFDRALLRQNVSI